MVRVSLPISHRMKFASQFIVVAVSFHLLQYAQLHVNLLQTMGKNQIGKIAILAHIVLAVKARIEL